MHRLNKKYVEERNAPAGVFGESYGKSQDKVQTDSVYTSVNVQPEFPGGYTALVNVTSNALGQKNLGDFG
jgi:hypothetical protein